MFRNIAIIAHVDHGKTTLVDAMLQQCHAFSSHQEVVDRVMDSMDLERERGITITSKNTSVTYKGTKINIMDTPGHADFGGEVERVMKMVETAMLLVDASEGPLPQTRFVLRKAMDAGLTLMVCINKIDRPDQRIAEVLDEIYDLFIDLDASEEQLDFPIIYACAKDGTATLDLDKPSTDLKPLLDIILEKVPSPPPVDTSPDAMSQMLVTNLGYDPYVGRIAIGRLLGGTFKRNQMVTWFGEDLTKRMKMQLLYTWDGLKRVEVSEVSAGDVVAVAGIPDITVGDTLANGPAPVALPRLHIDEPTIGMMFGINDSPFSGQDGNMLTGRQIRERIERELIHNVSMRMEYVDGVEGLMVYGRGELQLCILIEQMRREGFELTVSRPIVVKKEVEGVTCEPFERLTLDVPDEFVGALTQMLSARKGLMEDLLSDGNGRTSMVYVIPSRGLIGYRSEMLTTTRGMGIANTEFEGWFPQVGFIGSRKRGGLVSDRQGKTNPYALFHLQPRGILFVDPSTPVYEGMVVGLHAKDNDLNVNATKGKNLSNVRTAGTDEKLILTPASTHNLETAIEWIDEDERVEVTPKTVRIRKAILASNMRSIVRKPKGT
jgi:GTP-binding protein